ncbi:DUF4286 family protein [Propionivibrio dicarboxylicus]|uniref:Uncharacterized protein n=1 Tax=Propionivibrio dicarboxylicus TaxID=83767 RepID=A0A1G8F287_9RHOO|nr:DUF4286 family protein [Propionivibrio dicarboxylicus]SDH76221.1 hypothetical protein SAMN05660652_02270 [Propionivibrio dicarboxylicus]
MALLGEAAMILAFDIAPNAISEHDHWHSHEHLHERMSIPGFLRGSRWSSKDSSPRYFVMYEVSDLETLSASPYLDRLNNPSVWTAKMMKYYHGMNRGFCRLVFSGGYGLGSYCLLLRFSPDPEHEVALRDWLARKALASLHKKTGLVSAHQFEAALTPEMTKEQRIRGKDSGVDWVLLVTGYDKDAVGELAAAELSVTELERHGCINLVSCIYQMEHSLSRTEIEIPDSTD